MLADSTIATFQPGATVRRARVYGAELDNIAARRSTERLLTQLPETVSGMSASAVLCVRQMSVHVRSKSRYMQQGNSILGEEMDRLVRHAARPAYGPVPIDAAAVLFTDRAELLSCLARDYVRHLLAQSWWWRVLLPGSDLAVAAMQLWVNEAAQAPAALARLARTQDAVAFVGTLADAEASAVMQAMVRAHGLALLAEDVSVAPLSQSHSPFISPAHAMSRHGDAYTSFIKLEQEIQAALPELRTRGLSAVQRRLLAVGLSLVRIPGLVRSAAYAQVLSELLAQANSQTASVEKSDRAFDRESYVKADHVSGSLPSGASAIFPSPAAGRGSGRRLPETNTQDVFRQRDGYSVDRAPPVQSSLLSSALHAGESEIVRSPTTGRGLGRGPPDSGASIRPDTGLETRLLQDESLPGAQPTVAMRSVATPDIVATPNKSVPELAPSLLEGNVQRIESEYGGVLFLCNAALALDLYPDVTRPLDRGLELSFWDFLALAAVDLGGPGVRRDPLWSLLAELAGRKPGKRPGTGFFPPCEWRMPVEWLLPFAGDVGDWTWEADAARLVVRHPAGFVVLDLPRTEISAEQQLRVEIAHYQMPCSNGAPAIRQASRCRHSSVAPLARWRGWLMPYLGRRVALALGDVRWRRACRQLLSMHGRIECDAERLEVHFSLEQLPVMVRIAGLDRDPGWIPAAGRDVRFYFGCDDA